MSEHQSADLFGALCEIDVRPEPFAFYSAQDLWTNEHISRQMLAFHLDENADVASRRPELIDRCVEWITDHFDVGVGTRIVDFGCGPGLYTERFAERGAAVTGIDFSLRSIDFAQVAAAKKDLRINYVNQDYLEFETTESFELILMLMYDFCALSPTQRASMLRKFSYLLEPGGAAVGGRVLHASV